ncbi:MAG: hypothetical protein H6570_14270 [Lewinellaceae bacterium]|nr:hypothetical protein [Lewinellaceae bacterium]
MTWKYNLLGLLQLVVALGAIPAGLALIIYPDGAAVGMSTTLLSQAPFKDFLIPGLFLLIGNGLSNGFGGMLAFLHRPVAGTLGLLLGVFLMAWVLIQVYFIGYLSFLQPLMFGLGVIISGLGWLIVRSKEGQKAASHLPI